MRPHHRFWPTRLPHQIQVPATSLWDNLEFQARRFPDKTAIVFFGCEISYRELVHQAERVAARLHALGVRKGDRVVLLMQNSPQLIAAHYGILRANAVVVPVNPMNRPEELKHYITDPQARVALVTADLAAGLAKASNESQSRLADAERRAQAIIEEAKLRATEEGNKIVAAAVAELSLVAGSPTTARAADNPRAEVVSARRELLELCRVERQVDPAAQQQHPRERDEDGAPRTRRHAPRRRAEHPHVVHQPDVPVRREHRGRGHGQHARDQQAVKVGRQRGQGVGRSRLWTSRGLAVLGRPVGHVLLVAADEQVLRIDAGPHVAAVAHVLYSFYLAMKCFPECSVDDLRAILV